MWSPTSESDRAQEALGIVVEAGEVADEATVVSWLESQLAEKRGDIAAEIDDIETASPKIAGNLALDEKKLMDEIEKIKAGGEEGLKAFAKAALDMQRGQMEATMIENDKDGDFF